MINLSKNLEFRVKWAGPNTPIISIVNTATNEEHVMTVSKVDLRDIYNELLRFMNFYYSAFTPDNIKTADDPFGDYNDFDD